MKDFSKLSPQEIADILNDKTDTVVITNQLLTNTVGQKKNEWFQLSMPVFPKEVIEQIVAQSITIGQEQKSYWNTFIIILNYLGADIWYNNQNDVDCYVSIKFKENIGKEKPLM